MTSTMNARSTLREVADYLNRMKKAMNHRRQTIIAHLAQLKEEGFTKTSYTVAEITWDDCARLPNSVYGVEIADVFSFIRSSGGFAFFNSDESAVNVESELLHDLVKKVAKCAADRKEKPSYREAFPRSESVVACGHVYEMIYAKPVTRSENSPVFAYVVKTEGGVRVFDYTFVGSVHLLVEDVRDPHNDGVHLMPFSDTTFKPGDEHLKPSGQLQSAHKRIIERTETASCAAVEGGLAVAFECSNGAVRCLNFGGVGIHYTALVVPEMNLPAYTIIPADTFTDHVAEVELDATKVVIADEKLENPRMGTVHELLRGAGIHGKPYGMNGDVDLSRPNERATLRMQACIVPGDKTTEFYQKVFSYSSFDGAPTAVYSYCTGLGTAWAEGASAAVKIQPAKFDDEKGEMIARYLSVKPSEKKAKDSATYTESENLANLAKGESMAVPLGPLGFPKTANATLLLQTPIAVEGVERPSSLSKWADEGGGCVYRSCCGMEEDAPEGELMASTTGLGSEDGVAKGICNGAMKRRNDGVPPTMTYTSFFSIVPKPGCSGGLLPGEFNVSFEDIKTVVKQLDDLYEIAGGGKTIHDSIGSCTIAPTVPPAVSALKGSKVGLKRERSVGLQVVAM